jgi:hypothetical protein
MNMEHKISFAMKKSKSDEWYTPESGVLPILKYIKPNSKIWCPFDGEESNYVKLFKEKGFKVVNTHISTGGDFFKIAIPDCDYIISNPPYSMRNQVLQKLFSLNKPFAMLMNTNGLFDSQVRWDLFKINNFTLIYLKGRTSFFQEQGVTQTTPLPSVSKCIYMQWII